MCSYFWDTTLVAIAGFVGVLLLPYPISALNWRATSAPTTNWTGVASSADGSKLTAVALGSPGSPGPIYTSMDSGVTWKQTSAPLAYWCCVASSEDGTKLAAAPIVGGSIYTSVDSGDTWIENDTFWLPWSAIASSADGSKIVASTGSDYGIFTLDSASNPGWTWVETSAPYRQWRGVASSADGRRLIAAALALDTISSRPGSVWTSADSGVTWNFEANVPLGPWQCVACSSNGTRLVAMGNGPVYTSADSGVSWQKAPAPVRSWSAVASSADATRLLAVASDIRRLFVSTNSGVNWTDAGARAADWTAVASSADGSKLVAVAGGGFGVGQIYLSSTASAPLLSITVSGNKALISWPGSATGFGLQENADLLAGNWIDLTTTPLLTNQQNQVSVSISEAARFYRLKHP